MNSAKFLRLVDWIWTVRGSLPLSPDQAADEAFAGLDTLLRDPGTSRRIDGDTLIFHKVNPLSQDKLAVFDRGRLQVSGGELGYVLSSKALGFCFLAPLFFLGVSALIDGSRISGRVFAAMFAVLYIVGRLLEPWLVARLFARRLAGTDELQQPGVPA